MVCIANAMCPVQFDDTKGFHTGPSQFALQQCYLRGAQMVNEIAQRTPLLTAITVCVDVKYKPVIQPKKDELKKVGPLKGEY